jgi:hypothetical protein
VRGLREIGNRWHLYDPNERTLVVIIGNADWQMLVEAAKMRNDMIHGTSVYPSADCIARAKGVLASLQRVKQIFDDQYGFSGWTSNTIRKKSTLHSDPRVSV